MRVLVACEFSGVVRRAFRAMGHDAWSCDLLPAEDGDEHHIQGDAIEAAYGQPWDLMISHAECTFLTNAGVKHLYHGGRKENGPDLDRWQKMEAGAAFYNKLLAAPIEKIAAENPVMHGYAQKLVGGKATQYVQPWWFGEPFFKATGLRLKNLAKLVATNKLTPPRPGTSEHKRWSKIHRMPPGPDRWKERSRTFEGIAKAMAEQWGSLPHPPLSHGLRGIE